MTHSSTNSHPASSQLEISWQAHGCRSVRAVRTLCTQSTVELLQPVATCTPVSHKLAGCVRFSRLREDGGAEKVASVPGKRSLRVAVLAVRSCSPGVCRLLMRARARARSHLPHVAFNALVPTPHREESSGHFYRRAAFPTASTLRSVISYPGA